MLQTVRQSARLLLKSPTTTVAAVASLALGIGANSTVFTLIDAVVLRPLPVQRSDELVAVRGAHQFAVSYPAYRDLASGARQLTGLAAFAPRAASLSLGGTSAVGEVQVVSGNYFDLLGVGAIKGRVLSVSDDVLGADPVVVVSSAFWQQSLGSDASVIGRSVDINRSRFRIVGVAQANFHGVTLGENPVGWITINAWPRIATGFYLRIDLNSRGWGWLRMFGRLREGVQPVQARDELNALAASALRDSGPDSPEIDVTPLNAAATGVRSRGGLTRYIALLLAVVLAVLGIACANVSGLLLARALARRRELAIRIALGASRGRIIRELMVDSALLGGLGAIFGVLVAMWTIDLLQRVRLPGGIDMSHVNVTIGLSTLAATAALAILATVLVGLLPAVQGARGQVVASLKDQPLGGVASRQWLRGGLVALQVTLSLVLLVGTALFARTLQATLSSDLGFEPDNVAYAATNISLQRYDGSRAVAFYQETLEKARAIPGVTAAGWTRLIPGGGQDSETVRVPGYVSPNGRTPIVSTNLVTSGYFEAMRTPILKGRSFADEDARSAVPVVVVNDAAAKRFWNGDAVGRQFSINNMTVTVVGVARDVAPEPGATAEPFVYGHAQQIIDGALGTMHLIARTARPAGAVARELTNAIHAAAPPVAVLEARTMNEQLLDLLGAQRSAAALLGLMSVIALVLSAGGIYAMVAFWVNERTREFGVRMALGATGRTIRTLALTHAAKAVVIGMLIGMPLAWGLGLAARGLLFDLSPADPLSFSASVVVLLLVALAATLIPAQLAARTDPLKALRAGTE